jgi:hypothetical protein
VLSLPPGEYGRKAEKGESLNSSVQLGKDLAYLVGALRDGSVFYNRASRNYTIVWYEKSHRWLEDSIAKRVKKTFGKNACVSEYKPGQFRARFYSMEALEVFKSDF